MKNKNLTFKIGEKKEIHLAKMNLENDQIAALKAAKEVQRDMFSLERRLKNTTDVNDLEKIVDEAKVIVQRYNNLWTVYARVNTLRMDKKNSSALLSRAEEKLRDSKNTLSVLVYEAEKLYKQIFKIDVDNASIMEIQSGIVLCRKLREIVNKGLRFDQKNNILSVNLKIADDMEAVFKQMKKEYKAKKEAEEKVKKEVEEEAKAKEEAARKAARAERAKKRKEEQKKVRIDQKVKKQKMVESWICHSQAVALKRGKKKADKLHEECVTKASAYLAVGKVDEAVNVMTAAQHINNGVMGKIKKKVLKAFFKDLAVRILPEIEISIEEDENCKTYPEFKSMVVAQQETQLMRCCQLKEMILTDDKMSLVAMGTDDIINISIDNSVFDVNNRGHFLNIFDALKNGVYVIYNRKSGAFRFMLHSINFDSLTENEECFKYKFLGITPSGLRSGTLSCAKTGYYDSSKGLIEEDHRLELIDNALDGVFQHSFLDDNGEIIEKEIVEAFKASSRLMQSSTASKPLFKAENYIVLDNVAEFAGYLDSEGNKISCKDTKDGAIVIASESVVSEVEGTNINDVRGLCLQVRGASLKGAGVVKDRFDLETLLYAVLEAAGKEEAFEYNMSVSNYKELGLKVLKDTEHRDGMMICIDGVQYKGDSISMDIVEKALSKVQFIGDWNAFKATGFNATWDILALKKANISDSKAGSVINLMLQANDSKRANEIIEARTKDIIASKFESLGIELTKDEEGDIVDISFNKDKLLRTYSNDSQFGKFLLQSKEDFLYIMPQLIKGDFQNIVKSIRKTINFLNPRIDSYYTVIQSDSAPLFGVRILGDREFYCNDLPKNVEEVSAVRHPISTLLSVSTLKRVSREEIERRILALDISDRQKVYLRNEFFNSQDHAIIPASHDLMEKHDGMDFDIDAMQLITDAEVVSILKKTPDITIVIDRKSDAAKGISTSNSKAELRFQEFINSGESILGENPDNKPEKKENMEQPVLKGFKFKSSSNNNKKEEKIKLNLDSICDMDRDYFANPIAPIGVISSGFYNNVQLLNELINGTEENKKLIVASFRTQYGCNSNNSYVSPLNVTITKEGHEAYILDKTKCMQVVYNYANSKGTLKDTIAFLRDCCRCNRYPGETSIDSAKKKYVVIDMFNHGYFIKALGSDKNLKVEAGKIDKLYAEIVYKYNEMKEETNSANNFFKIDLLYFEENRAAEPKSVNEAVDCVNKAKAQRSKNKYGQAVSIKDSFYYLKKDLIDYTNNLLVFASKELEKELSSNKACKQRQALIDEVSRFASNKGVGNTNTFIGNLISISSCIQETIGYKEIEFNDMSAHVYKKDSLIAILRNTKELLLKGFNNKEKAQIVMAYAASQFEKNKESGCPTINSAIFKAFDDDFVNGFGLAAGEKIKAIIEDNNMVFNNPKSLQSHSISFADGVGYLTCLVEDKNKKGKEIKNLTLFCENKKFSGDGVIQITENGTPYVVFNKETGVADPSKGIVVKINNSDGFVTKFIEDRCNFDNLSNLSFSMEYGETEEHKKTNYRSNCIVCKNGNKKHHLAFFIANKVISGRLLTVKEAKMNIFYNNHDSENCLGYIQIFGEEIERIINERDSFIIIPEPEEKENKSSRGKAISNDDLDSLFGDISISSAEGGDDVVLENTTLEDFLK